MVLKPLPFLKIVKTERPSFFHRNVSVAFRGCLFGLRDPKTPSKEEMNTLGVMPSAECDLQEDTKVLARSSNASASAICSLGFLTSKQTQS